MQKNPALTVDAVVFDRLGRLLLIKRANHPFAGQYALPGGFVDYGETVEAAARRELLEETGVTTSSLQLVGVYSDPKRDPRGHTVSVAFLMTVDTAKPEAGDDAAAAEFVTRWQDLKLAFDHNQIASDAWKKMQNDA